MKREVFPNEANLAAQMRVVRECMETAADALSAGNPTAAMRDLVSAKFIYANMLVELEKATDIPWFALGYNPEFGKEDVPEGKVVELPPERTYDWKTP